MDSSNRCRCASSITVVVAATAVAAVAVPEAAIVTVPEVVVEHSAFRNADVNRTRIHRKTISGEGTAVASATLALVYHLMQSSSTVVRKLSALYSSHASDCDMHSLV
jgi:hypothetical protein